jgi:UDP-N-acetylmuramate: L-alanyl-gamma-D-glutamyl-meso-diaminopimelate ligase
MKLGVMKDMLAPSLSDAQLVFCYTGGIGWDAQGALTGLGGKVACYDDLAQLVEGITAAARRGDHVLVMSNGGFGGIHAKLLTALAAA